MSDNLILASSSLGRTVTHLRRREPPHPVPLDIRQAALKTNKFQFIKYK
jgi:hypothetical protein